jgi:hypothetical protein
MAQFWKRSDISNWRVLLASIYIALRYYAAFVLLGYGFAKIMGAQFTVLDSQLARPMGEVSGFWLTWYYFGYSPLYASIVAWAQVLGAVLLCFRRTALIGTLVLIPIMVNIVAIDIWVIRFPLASGALQNALYVLIALLFVLAFHAQDIHRFLMQKRDSLALLLKENRPMVAVQFIVVASMIGYTAHKAHWIANVNNRAPTPIDGAWHLTQTQPTRPDLPQWFYFEYNRAHMVVFDYSDGKSETHDFRVDPRTKTLNIAREWLMPGSDVFKGTWERDGDTLHIRGTWGNTATVDMTLQRKQVRVKDHE